MVVKFYYMYVATTKMFSCAIIPVWSLKLFSTILVHIHTHTHTYIIYREREGERERERERERNRQTFRESETNWQTDKQADRVR